MDIQENVLLAPYTTFKIGGPARYFCAIQNLDDLKKALEFAQGKQLKIFILEGGSNLLVSDRGFDGLVIKIELTGKKVIREDREFVWLEVAAGEIWDEVVELTVKKRWWGIENLSHIPGKTGAIAVQNVGAYGQEASQVVETVTVYDIQEGNSKTLRNRECGFGYRRSIFNFEQKGRYVILQLVLKLDKAAAPELTYWDLKQRFAGKLPLLADIRQAIIDIRDKKFPFPTVAKNGNAGSFFKNPILSPEAYELLKQRLQENFTPDVAEKIESKKFGDNGQIKIPAAFLIDICGLKDLSRGGAAVNRGQPLVIVNKTGNATAANVLELANAIKNEVKTKTGVGLIFEPELVGFE